MNKKFYESYKSLNIKGVNYLELLSINLLNCLSEMKDKRLKFYEIFELANVEEKELVVLSFNHLHELFWDNFCNLMRDYSNILYQLLNKIEGKKIIPVEKHLKIKEYIDSTKFISVFMGSKEFTALSLSLHNHNILDYGNLKYDESFSKYKEFDNVIHYDIDDIRHEFENIFFLFQIIDDSNYNNDLSNFINNGKHIFNIEYSPIFKMFDFLLNKIKK